MVMCHLTLYKSPKIQQMAWSISRKALIKKRSMVLNSLHFLEKLFKISHLKEICNTLNTSFKNINEMYSLFFSHRNSKVFKHFRLDKGLAPLSNRYFPCNWYGLAPMVGDRFDPFLFYTTPWAKSCNCCRIYDKQEALRSIMGRRATSINLLAFSVAVLSESLTAENWWCWSSGFRMHFKFKWINRSTC